MDLYVQSDVDWSQMIDAICGCGHPASWHTCDGRCLGLRSDIVHDELCKCEYSHEGVLLKHERQLSDELAKALRYICDHAAEDTGWGEAWNALSNYDETRKTGAR